MKKILLVIAILLIQACAYKDSTLKVNHDANEKFRGPIAESAPLSFIAASISDEREDKARIGWKKNGFGSNTADITTEEPVETIVTNAITTGLLSNDHKVTNDGLVKVEGKVNRFWFEMDTNLWSVEFTGNVQCDLKFINTKTNSVFYTAEYSGSYSEKKGAGLKKTWQKVMSKAVDNLIEDIVFDEDLAEALGDL